MARLVVDAAYAVHRRLGPGLLESIYEACLEHECAKRGLIVERQVSIPIGYDNLTFEGGLRLDMLVNQSVIVEVKAVELVSQVHRAQLLTYLKLSGKRLGLLINFNIPCIKDGIKRIAL